MVFRIFQRIVPFALACTVALPGYADNLIAFQLPHDTQEYRGYAIVEFADGTSAVASANRDYGQFKIGAHTVDDIHAIHVEGDATYTNSGKWRTTSMMPGSIREYTLISLSNEVGVEAPAGMDSPVAAADAGPAAGPREPNRPRPSGGGGRLHPGKKGKGAERTVFRWGLWALLAAVAAGGAKWVGKLGRAGEGRSRFVPPHMEVAGDWRGIYDIVSVGKSGGFGDTYTVREKAWWKWRKEVLKVLKGTWTQGTWSGDRIWVEQMKHECDHLDYLEGWGYRHAPRILKRGGLLNPTRQGSEAWFTMTMIRGISLKKALRTIGTCGFRRRLAMVKALTKALAELHRYGIAHRDLTPENIFVRNTFWGVHADLIDFGSAKRQKGGQTVGVTFPPGIAFVGKTSYCAPEHLRNINQAGIPSDDYALGVLCCQILLGDNPFKSGSSREEALAHHLQVDRWGLANRLCREGGVKAEVAMYLAGNLLKPEEEGRGTASEFLRLLNGSYPFA